jgi:hypothetical protein
MARRLTDRDRLLRSFSEDDVVAKAEAVAKLNRWEYRHFTDSRKQVRTKDGRTLLVGDEKAKGWPDHVFLRPPELVVAEFKTELGDFRPGQQDMLAMLRHCMIEVWVVRPSNLDDFTARLAGPSRGRCWRPGVCRYVVNHPGACSDALEAAVDQMGRP